MQDADRSSFSFNKAIMENVMAILICRNRTGKRREDNKMKCDFILTEGGVSTKAVKAYRFIYKIVEEKYLPS